MDLVFIDDEEQILKSIQRALRREKNLNCEFFSDPQQAMQYIKENSIDAVISDMKMPEYDGVYVLNNVRKISPNTERYILSGEASEIDISRCILIAHQFFAKPCQVNIILNRIKANHSISMLINDKIKKSVLSKMQVPILPQAYNMILDELQKEEPSLKEISKIFEEDIALSSKILSITNSAYFGLPNKVLSVRNAINYLGLDIIGNLVLHVKIFESTSNIKLKPIIKKINSYSLTLASICKDICSLISNDPTKKKLAYQSALFNSLGILTIAEQIEDKYIESISTYQDRESLEDISINVAQVPHGIISAFILSKWGFSSEIVSSQAKYLESYSTPQDSLITISLAIATISYPWFRDPEYSKDCIDKIEGIIGINKLELTTNQVIEIVNQYKNSEVG